MPEFVWELPALQPTATPIPEPNVVDDADAAIARLPQQFRTKPKIVAIMRVLCAPMAPLRAALNDLLTKRSIDTSEGEQLNILARIVGQEIIEDVTATTLHSLIRARVRANKSSGLGDQILLVARLVLTDFASQVDVVAAAGALKLIARNIGRASFVLVVDQPDIPWDVAELLQTTFIRRIASTAVRGTLEFYPQETTVYDVGKTNAFRFVDQLGETPEAGGGFGSTTDATIGGQLFAAME